MIGRPVSEEFRCAKCGETFSKAWSEEEARAEEAALFGANDPDAAVLCDDCYRAFLRWFRGDDA